MATLDCRSEDDDVISCCSDVGEINISDSQVMIQLKEAGEEAELLRLEIAQIKKEIEEINKQSELDEDDAEVLQEKQLQLIEKLQQLDKLTCLIAKLMELAAGMEEEEELPKFEDDLLPRVIVCSSWDDMMPKVVVCIDQKKKTLQKKGEDVDDYGLSPDQREALEAERRAREEEREKLQMRVAQIEGEMRVMLRENDMLSKKVAELKQNQPQPFEFEMSVSGTQQPGQRHPGSGGMNFSMGPTERAAAGGNYEMGATLRQGDTVLGTMQMTPRPGQGDQNCFGSSPHQNYQANGRMGSALGPIGIPPTNFPPSTNRNCSGPYGVPGQNIPCPNLGGNSPGFVGQRGAPVPPASRLGPGGKPCRKQFLKDNIEQGAGCPCNPGGKMPPTAGVTCQQDELDKQALQSQLEANKPQPIDVNFKLNVGPTGPGTSQVGSIVVGGKNSVARPGGGPTRRTSPT